MLMCVGDQNGSVLIMLCKRLNRWVRHCVNVLLCIGPSRWVSCSGLWEDIVPPCMTPFLDFVCAVAVLAKWKLGVFQISENMFFTGLGIIK